MNIKNYVSSTLHTPERTQSILKKTEGRIEGKGGAADRLGLHPSTLRVRMKKLNIAFGRVVKYS